MLQQKIKSTFYKNNLFLSQHYKISRGNWIFKIDMLTNRLSTGYTAYYYYYKKYHTWYNTRWPFKSMISIVVFVFQMNSTLKKLGLAATRFEIELCMAKDDNWMSSLQSNYIFSYLILLIAYFAYSDIKDHWANFNLDLGAVLKWRHLKPPRGGGYLKIVTLRGVVPNSDVICEQTYDK